MWNVLLCQSIVITSETGCLSQHVFFSLVFCLLGLKKTIWFSHLYIFFSHYYNHIQRRSPAVIVIPSIIRRIAFCGLPLSFDVADAPLLFFFLVRRRTALNFRDTMPLLRANFSNFSLFWQRRKEEGTRSLKKVLKDCWRTAVGAGCVIWNRSNLLIIHIFNVSGMWKISSSVLVCYVTTSKEALLEQRYSKLL